MQLLNYSTRVRLGYSEQEKFRTAKGNSGHKVKMQLVHFCITYINVDYHFSNCLFILCAIKLFRVDALCFLSQIRLDINLSYFVPKHALTLCFPSKSNSC